MGEYRKIKKIIHGTPAVDGAGVHLVRVLGKNDAQDTDPFLMLDAFDSIDPKDYIKGFPWHPHRGIETITYLIKGRIEHGDSLGNSGVIGDGECQWMTAGSGIIHQEMPKPAEKMFGVQLWLNLPAKDKMTVPKYHGITVADIPVVDEDSGHVRVLAGSYKGKAGAMDGEFVKPLYLDVALNPGAEWSLDTNPEDTLFIYILQGGGESGEKQLTQKSAVLFGEGESFFFKASGEGARFLLLSAKPLKEPIAWGGPIVMNTYEELSQAFKELDENTFIK